MRRIVILAICIVLSACSGKPSVSQIREQVLEQIVTDSNRELIAISDFDKTNGFEKDQNTYVVNIKYKVTFKKSLQELARDLQQDAKSGSPTGNTAVDKQLNDVGGALAGIGIIAMGFQYGDFRAGDSFEKTDKVVFIKTDNGWRLAGRPQSAL